MAHRHIYRTITRKKPYNTQLQDDLEFVLPMSKHLPFLPLLYMTDVCTMLSVLIGNIYFVYIVSLCNDYKLFVYIYILTPPIVLKTFDCSRSAWTFKNIQDCMLSNNLIVFM